MPKNVWKTSKLNDKLKRKLKAGPERGGVILADGQVVEIDNISSDPNEGYAADLHQLLVVSDDAVATWHTHPNATANLSVEDWQTFVQWPDLLHAVVGTDGVRWYGVKGAAVINA